MKLLQDNTADFIIQNCREGIFMFDHELRFTSWNTGMEELTGYSAGECVGIKADELFPFLKTSGNIDIYRKVLQGKSHRSENQSFYISTTRRYVNYAAQYYPIWDIDGNISGGIGILQDESTLSAAIQALEDAEKRFINLLEQAPLPIAVISEKEVLYANCKTLQLFGLKKMEEVIGQSPFNFIADSSKSKAAQDIENILAGKIVEPVEHMLVNKDGTEVYAEIAFIRISYLGQDAIQIIIRDITEQTKNYQELHKHKRLLGEAQSMALLGGYQLNFPDKSIFWADEVYNIFELDKDNFSPNLDYYYSLLEEKSRLELIHLVKETIEKKLLEANHTHKVKLQNGKEKHIRLIGRPIFSEAGEIVSIVGTVQDITEQKKTEEELFRANQILNLHFENSPIGVIQLNSSAEITRWSKQAENIFGWEAVEVMGKRLTNGQFIHEDHKDELNQLKENILNSSLNYRKGILKFYTKKNTIVYCEYFLSGITAENGRLHSVFFMVNDVTSRKLAEQARSEGQLEERKRIAREIHDGVGQMLIAIKYKLAGLEDIIEKENHNYIHNLESMLEQTLEEVRSVSRNLGPRSVATQGLESSLRQLCEQIKRLTAINLKFRYIGGEQVINNKIVNALYRIAQEATQNMIKHAQASQASIQVFQGRNFIELKVEDNGIGIQENTLKRKGNNGQGLKNMEERVKLLDGRFQLYSEEGHGTTLIINIPLNNPENEN